MIIGDLVAIKFGIGKNEYGILMGFASRCSRNYSRVEVFWEGDMHSIPLNQLEKISENT